MNLVIEHSYFDKKTQQVDGRCSNQPINYMGAHNLHMAYYIHTLWSFKPQLSSPQFSFWFINCSTHYVASSSDNHQYHLSLWWRYYAEPIFLSVLLTSLEPISILGVLDSKLSSSSFVMFSSGFHGSNIILSSLSSNFIILASVHVVESSSTYW